MNLDLLFRLGVVLDKSGDKKGCLEQMQRIVEIDPDHADALNYIGYTYAEQGIRLDEALEMVRKALELKPESGYITDSLGWVYYQKGLYDKALNYLEKANALVPDEPTITEHLGDVYMKTGRLHQALKMYQKALTLKGEDLETIREKIDRVEELLGNPSDSGMGS
jgi:tetratricopeptide (TPR) repeat protein